MNGEGWSGEFWPADPMDRLAFENAVLRLGLASGERTRRRSASNWRTDRAARKRRPPGWRP